MSKTRLSIITVAYNNLAGLEKTVASVLSLNYDRYEMIIIDGCSTDGTQAFLESINHDKIQWISEPDNGIYDAMNKGVSKSNSDYIIFMNAGDTFFTEQILTDIKLPEQPSVLYGACEIKYPTGYSRRMQPKNLDTFWQSLPFSHQSVIIASSLMQKGFNTNYKYCADYNLLYQLKSEGVNYVNTQKTIAQITAGGVSDKKRYLATAEVYKISRTIQPSFRLHFYFLPKIISSFISVKFQSILPQKWRNYLYKLKYN